MNDHTTPYQHHRYADPHNAGLGWCVTYGPTNERVMPERNFSQREAGDMAHELNRAFGAGIATREMAL